MTILNTTRTIYLDNAATTSVSQPVADLVVECMRREFGNPASAHHIGVSAERRVEHATNVVADLLGDPKGLHGKILFCSGGTEADAIGVIGAARARPERRAIMISAIEHPAVVESATELLSEGKETITIPATPDGSLSVSRVLESMSEDVGVVSFMLVNNELGSILPVGEISEAIRKNFSHEVHIHCDAVQAFGKVPISVEKLNVDSLAISAHKIHGPKGSGALWLKHGAKVKPLWNGGGQQDGIRSGTLNVPGIAGLGLAAENMSKEMPERSQRFEEMKSQLRSAAEASGVSFRENAAKSPRAPHILSLSFEDIPAQPLLHVLESRGILVSAGSACSERSSKPSRILTAIGLPENYGTLRISFGCETTFAEIEKAAETLEAALKSFS